MRRKDYIDEIIKYSSRFIEEVKQYNSSGLYDINIHAENFLIPVLNKVFDLDLENLNLSKQKNFPAIDLADFENRVGIQITSTVTSQKIENSLRKFVDNSLDDSFDVIYIFLLSDKQKKYPSDKFNQIVGDRIGFDINEHILDNSDLVARLTNMPLHSLEYLSRLYRHEFSDAQIEVRERQFKSKYLESASEQLFFNTLRISLPRYFYSAEIDIDEESALERINSQREEKGWKLLKSIKRDARLVRDELIHLEIYNKDWIIREGRLYTFKDLYRRNSSFSDVTNRGTIEKHKCKDYYLSSDDCLWIFKDLLLKTLIEDFHYKGLEWIGRKGIFRFKIDKNKKGPKKIKWKAKVQATKTVIFEMINKKEGHLICYKHLAFKPKIELLDDSWYLIINSTWSFTNPGGYRQSRFEESYLSGIKKLEANKSIYYFYRFWSYLLRYRDLFTRQPILTLQEFLPLSITPKLNDEKWLPLKEKKIKDDDVLKIDTELSHTLFD